MQNNISRKLGQLRPGDLLVGVDPHKHKHAIISMDQKAVVRTRFKVGNDRKGFEHLMMRVEQEAEKASASGLIFAIEAGGHYWRNLAYYLEEKGVAFRLINPFTLKRSREGEDLNRRKNDYRDAIMAAELLRMGKFTETRLPKGDYAELRALDRCHQRLKKEQAGAINLLRGLLDGLFPEFCRVFKDPTGQSATSVLCSIPVPEAIASLSLQEFIGVVRSSHQGGRLAVGKLVSLHQLASVSVGVKPGALGVASEIGVLVERLRLLATQIKQTERRLLELVGKLPEASYALSIKGLSKLMVARLIARIGPVADYGNAKDLIKLAGTNPTQSESAGKSRSHTPMSKKGRSDLRGLLWLAAMSLLRHNEEFKDWAKGLENRAAQANPLHRREVLGAAMNRLLRLYFALVTKTQMYRPATTLAVAA
ncbi:MAG: IS110 family transposase [Dehalococcoidia bacterium]|nr:IS110 family transposase [Dehalococcoidia bacterium]